MSSAALNPRRLGILMRNDLQSARTAAITLAAAAGASFVLYFLTLIGGGSSAFHAAVYPIILFVLGYVISSFTFSEIHETRTGAFALTSPGSLLEKYIGRIVLTSVGWTIAVTVSYMAVTAVATGISELLFGSSHGVFLPSGRWVWQAVGAYVVSQCIFVFGSIYFRKAAFIKTVLAAAVIAIIFGFFFVIAWRVVFWGSFSSVFPSDAEVSAVINVETAGVRRLVDVMETVGDVVRWAVIPIFVWIAGYLRLRETEV